MPKRYDASFKEMFAHNFLALLRWLLPELSSAQVLKLPEELPVTARRADLMMRVRPKRGSAIRPPDLIVVFECQCQRDPTLHKALLLRAVLAHTLHGLPVKTIVLALSPRAVPPPGHVFGQGPDGEELWHRVTVRRVFDESADDALASGVAELLPLVTAMRPRDGDPDRLLRRVVTQIVRQAASDDKRKIMLEQAATFATLRLPESQVSVIVHDVLRRNRYMLNPLRDFPYLRAGQGQGRGSGARQRCRARRELAHTARPPGDRGTAGAAQEDPGLHRRGPARSLVRPRRHGNLRDRDPGSPLGCRPLGRRLGRGSVI
jgi:hypothetical protein